MLAEAHAGWPQAAATSAGSVAEAIGRAGSGVPCLVAALIIREAILHRLLGREPLGASFFEVVATLGTGVSVILPRLMIGIDQGIVRPNLSGMIQERPSINQRL